MASKSCQHNPVHKTARCYPFKRLIVCCDGTWQASNQGTRSVPSNIAKISRCIKPIGPADEYGNGACPQIIYYDAGVGTAMGWLDKKYSGAFGEGLSENVCEAYNFLVNNYEKGDELYIFGFSRGGYTARALAGLVATVGICRNDMMDQFWEMYEAYCGKDPDKSMESTEWGESGEYYKGVQGAKGNGARWLQNCDKKINIKIVGVFDTVGSLGWPDSKLINFTYKNENKKYGFHNTNIHPNIKNAFHALALDEKRRPFSPTLWYLPEGNTETNLQQCWFPGVHINVGGGSDDGLKEIEKTKGDLESMANITFAWMVDRIREVSLLDFEMEFMFSIMDSYAEGLQKLLSLKQGSSTKSEVYRGWGVGPITDSYDSQDFVTRMISGPRKRTPGRYYQVDKDRNMTVPTSQKTKEYVDPDRKMILLTSQKTKEYIHPVVFHGRESPYGPIKKDDKGKVTRYSPPALSGFVRHDLPNSLGYVYYEAEIDVATEVTEAPGYTPGWVEWGSKAIGYSKPTPNKRTIQIPEFRIPFENEYTSFDCLERMLIQARPRVERKELEGRELSRDERKFAESKGFKTLQEDANKATNFLKELDKKSLLDSEVKKLVAGGLVIVEKYWDEKAQSQRETRLTK